jgi:tRNA-Thr(GGU) m(6)t(6)A37 methyltransferase TsaA
MCTPRVVFEFREPRQHRWVRELTQIWPSDGAAAADYCSPRGQNRVRADREKNVTSFEVKAIGKVVSSLTDLESAPRQADEGAPEAWLVFEWDMLEGLRSIRSGDEVIVITWLDRARRDVLSMHPRGDTSRAPEGVFSTRSPHRPNPIGLHSVEIAAIDGRRLRVRNLEALDGTPIIDLKPILSENIGER